MWCNTVVNMPLSQLFLKHVVGFNIKYLVFVQYSIEYRLKMICKSLYSVFIQILHNNPAFLESGLYCLCITNLSICVLGALSSIFIFMESFIFYNILPVMQYTCLAEGLKSPWTPRLRCMIQKLWRPCCNQHSLLRVDSFQCLTPLAGRLTMWCLKEQERNVRIKTTLLLQKCSLFNYALQVWSQ